VRQARPQAQPVPNEGDITSTHIFKGITQSLPFTNACKGASGTATITFSGVLQVTYVPSGPGAGTFQVSGHETGSGMLAPMDPRLPSYRGQFTSRFDANTNLDTGTATTTVNLHAVGSDGSPVNVHLVEQITITAIDVVVSFEHLTCG
jgi:hypothetical protein